MFKLVAFLGNFICTNYGFIVIRLEHQICVLCNYKDEKQKTENCRNKSFIHCVMTNTVSCIFLSLSKILLIPFVQSFIFFVCCCDLKSHLVLIKDFSFMFSAFCFSIVRTNKSFELHQKNDLVSFIENTPDFFFQMVQ